MSLRASSTTLDWQSYDHRPTLLNHVDVNCPCLTVNLLVFLCFIVAIEKGDPGVPKKSSAWTTFRRFPFQHGFLDNGGFGIPQISGCLPQSTEETITMSQKPVCVMDHS
jgi:hypothetical protein